MAEYIIQSSTLTSIANAIRSKNGTNTKMKPTAMASAISAISSGGPFSKSQAIEYTPTSNSKTFSLSHNLGAKPDGLIILNKAGTLDETFGSLSSFVMYKDLPDNTVVLCNAAGDWMSTLTNVSGYFTLTSTAVTANIGLAGNNLTIFLAGVTYLIIPFVV